MCLDAVVLPRDFGCWEGPLVCEGPEGLSSLPCSAQPGWGNHNCRAGMQRQFLEKWLMRVAPFLGREAAGRRITETCRQQLIDIFFFFFLAKKLNSLSEGRAGREDGLRHSAWAAALKTKVGRVPSAAAISSVPSGGCWCGDLDQAANQSFSRLGKPQLCWEVAWPGRGMGWTGSPVGPRLGAAATDVRPWVAVAAREGVWSNATDLKKSILWVIKGGKKNNRGFSLPIIANKVSSVPWKPGQGGITGVECGITGTPRTN